MGKSSRRTRSRKPRVLAVQVENSKVSLDAICDVNFQINSRVNAFEIEFISTQPGLEGKIVIDCEREAPTTDILVYLPSGVTYMYDRTTESASSTLSTSLANTHDTIKVPPYNSAIISYYFDSRNFAFFTIQHSYSALHQSIS